MKKEQLETKFEIFVCNHKREDGECCFDKGSKDLTDDLKKWAKDNYRSEMKVYRSGCLSKCSEGIAIACYPEKKFLLEVKTSDAQEIKKGLEEALKKFKD